MSHDPPDPFMDDKKTQKLLQETLKAMPQSVSESTTAILQAIETEAEVVTLRAERDLLFDALNLHMRKTGITNEAMERVEAFRAVVDANEPLVRGECTRLAKGWNDAADARKAAEAERDAALAACAEMRAALEHWTHIYSKALSPPGHDTYGEGMRDAKDQVRAILARTDLGRGMVVVPREVVERAQTVVGWYVDNGRGLPHGTRIGEKLLCDLDALLDGGKERG